MLRNSQDRDETQNVSLNLSDVEQTKDIWWTTLIKITVVPKNSINFFTVNLKTETFDIYIYIN